MQRRNRKGGPEGRARHRHADGDGDVDGEDMADPTDMERALDCATSLCNLALEDTNKYPIATSDCLQPLVAMAQMKDMEIARQACGCFANITEDVATHGVTHGLRYNVPLTNVALSPDDKLLVTGSYDGVVCVRRRSEKGEADGLLFLPCAAPTCPCGLMHRCCQ